MASGPSVEKNTRARPALQMTKVFEAAHARALIEVTPSCCTMHVWSEKFYARGFTSQSLDIAMAIGVRVPDAVRPPGGVPGRINERWFKADVVAMTCCYPRQYRK